MLIENVLKATKLIMVFNYKKNRAWAENLAVVMQIGLTMAGCIVFCFFIGLYLDKWLGTKGIFVAIFTILGVIGGAVTVYRQILKTLDHQPQNKNNSNIK
ncbi:MAG: AtpZ/AtpI family protein [Desulfobacterales bacterium]